MLPPPRGPRTHKHFYKHLLVSNTHIEVPSAYIFVSDMKLSIARKPLEIKKKPCKRTVCRAFPFGAGGGGRTRTGY